MSAIAEAARRLGEGRSLEISLACGACGKRGRYRVGAAVIDLRRLVESGARGLNDLDAAVSFTGIFRCDGCQADGPWKIPTMVRMSLAAKLLARSEDVVSGQLGLVDGTPARTGAEVVSRLRTLLDKEPGDARLWRRLGNAYRSGGVLDEAVMAWERALAIDPDDLESHFSLGIVAFEADAEDEALPHLHNVLRLARRKKDAIPLPKLREFLKETLRTLLDIGEERGDDVGVFPPVEPSSSRRDETVTVFGFDLSSEEEWDRWADLIMGVGEVSSLLREERDRGRRKRRW